MRHHNNIRKFGRKKDERNALLKHLAQSLVKNGKIKTTEAKAKELRPFIEKLTTRAKNPSLASRRILVSRLGSETLAKKLTEDIAPKYKMREGGYTRIIKRGIRTGDASKIAIIEFV
jgi:large subunit ribosomal protein L17